MLPIDANEPCLHHHFARVLGDTVEPCRSPRAFETPYCLDHLWRVAWLSLSVHVVKVRPTARPVPWLALLGCVALGVLLGSSEAAARIGALL